MTSKTRYAVDRSSARLRFRHIPRTGGGSRNFLRHPAAESHPGRGMATKI